MFFNYFFCLNFLPFILLFSFIYYPLVKLKGEFLLFFPRFIFPSNLSSFLRYDIINILFLFRCFLSLSSFRKTERGYFL